MIEGSRKGLWEIQEALATAPIIGKLFLLVLIALIPRVIVLLQPQIITNDGTLYIKMAKLFAEGRYSGTPGSYFNLYPFLIFLIQKLIGDWELSGQLISIVLGTLTVIPVFLLGRSLYNEKIGWLSSIFYITLPNFLEFDSQVIRDPTLWFFIAFTLWLVWEGTKQNRPILFGIASMSAGLASITRVEGFIVCGAVLLYMIFKKVEKISLKRKILNLSVFILLFPFLLSLALFSFKKNSDGMAIGEMTSFSIEFITAHARTVLKPLDPIEAMGEKTYLSLPMISQDSLELASRHRILLAISEVIYKFVKSSNLLFLFILFGFWKRKKEGFQSSDGFLLFVFGGLFIMSVLYVRQIYYFSTRHGLTLVLPTLFFAGHGLNFISEAALRRFHHLAGEYDTLRKYLPHVMTSLLAIVFLIQGISSKNEMKLLQKEIGLWLREKGFRGASIMGTNQFSRMAFYAEGKFLIMPDSWDKTIEVIQNKGVKIVVVDSCKVKEECPDFLNNWQKAGLCRIGLFKTGKEECVIEIYEIP